MQSLPFTDNVLIFSILLIVILVAPMVSRLIKLPGVVGIILTGVLIGPNGLNLLERSSAIELLGTAGLLYIMFMAGLEINMSDFKRNRNKSIVFGILTFAIPQFVGTVLFLALGFSWPAAILIASMFASHTLVAYPIITKLGLTRNNAVVTTVGGTILTDTVALLILAVVARTATGDLDAAFWIRLISLTAIYATSVIVLVPRFGRWFFKIVDDGTMQFLFVLAVAFTCSFLAKAIGIEAIVGAFLAGLVLNRLIPSSGPLINRVGFFGQSFLIPLFLLYIGMIVDVKVLIQSPSSWIIMFTMLATNMLTKLVSSKLTQKIFKFSSAEGWVIFGLSTTEAAATLAATLVGYRLGIIGDNVLNGVILMIMVTCVVGPWIVEHFGRKIKTDNSETDNTPQLLKNVLVPVANPDRYENLFAIALMLNNKNAVQISALSVITNTVEIESELKKDETILDQIKKFGANSEVEIRTLTRIDVNVANGISRAAKEERSNLLVLGWNGHTDIKQLIFGTTLDQILEQTTQAVLVCKIEKKVTLHKRMVIYFPHLAFNEPLLHDLFSILLLINKTMNADMLLVSNPDLTDQLEGTFDKQLKNCNYKIETVNTSIKTSLALTELVNHSDLLVVIGSRPHTKSWDISLNKLPRRITLQKPDIDMIVAYPEITYSEK